MKITTLKTGCAMFVVSALSLLSLQGCATVNPNSPPDVMFKEGEQMFQNGDYADAIAQWKKVKESYQSQELSTRAELNIADAYFLNKDYIEGAAAYEDFRKLHPKHEKAGYALYRQGMSHFMQIHGIDTDQTPVKNARTVFESYLVLYPAGEHVKEVTEKIVECREKQLAYELYVGKFYLKTGKLPGAIARFENALKTFADLPQRDEALLYLGRAYLENGEKAKGREVFGKLFKDFPASQYINDANKAMDKFF